MLLYDNYAINSDGNLSIGGVDTVELAKQYSTPLYVMDEDVVRANCRKFRSALSESYSDNGLICYASKSFSCKRMCEIVKEEGFGIDVVSGGELYTALAAGFNPTLICFHGNNKSDSELKYAVSNGVGRIIVDNLPELNRLVKVANELNANVGIMLRIKPGIDAHTHSFIQTGQIDSKFGFALETGEALEAVKLCLQTPAVTLRGLHCHIGSQILESAPFVLAAEVMLRFIAEIKSTCGYAISELNLGGGFGIRYTEEDEAISYNNYIKLVTDAIKSCCAKLGIDEPFIMFEPGRAISGPAGLTLYTIGAEKSIPNIRKYISIDGGMGDNPRYCLYQSRYTATIANKATEPQTELVTIAGKYCESGDLLGEAMPLQVAEPGDCLAVFSTGAYNYSMSSNYNRTPKPAVVFVSGGKSYIGVKRESFDDIIRNDA